jgi:hypothetical protein
MRIPATIDEAPSDATPAPNGSAGPEHVSEEHRISSPAPIG